MSLSSEMDHLESHVRDMYGRVVYTHKTHEKAADRLVWKQSWIKRLQLWLSAAVTAGLVGALLDAKWAGCIAVIISFILTILNAQVKGPELADELQSFIESCQRFWRLKEDLLSLLSDIGSGLSVEQVRSRRDELVARFAQASELAPRSAVLPKAFQDARKALRLGQEHTFSQDEIDAFLPITLRKGTPDREIGAKSGRAPDALAAPNSTSAKDSAEKMGDSDDHF